MILKFILKASLSGLLLLTPWQSAPAHAAPTCIKTIEGDRRLSSGIATAMLEEAVFVEHCDGGWSRVRLSEGVVRLTAAPRVPPERTADMLPDGEVTLGHGDISSARLIGPTSRYRHGILGDDVEASGMRVVLGDGRSLEFNLPGQAVFEDLRLRLVDLDGDGKDELIAIRSDGEVGAALAVYGVTGDGIALLAAGPAIGQPYRWLNPAGAADFDGDGAIEIAYVETPHIGGILRVYGLDAGEFNLEQSMGGFSNHAIGSRVLDMAAVIDWNGDGVPDLAIPDASRRAMRIISLAGGGLREIAAMAHPVPITTAVMAADLDGDGAPELIYGLSDGSLIITRP